MTSKKPIMFALLTAILVISMVSVGSAYAVKSFNDIADINPHCKNGSPAELYVSGTIDAVNNELFFAWAVDPSLYKYTGWWGTCTDLVTFEKITVNVGDSNPFIQSWDNDIVLGYSASSSTTVPIGHNISNGECMNFSYTVQYSGEELTVYPNKNLNCA